MKLGFLDSIYNYADVYEAAVKVFETRIPSTTLERMTVPHLLKIPLFSKMLLRNGADAVIVFLTMLEEDAAELDLVHEKIIDLELDEMKPVYFCIIADSEFKDQAELEAIMEQRLGMIAEAVSKIQSSPSGLAGDIANQDMTNAMSMFGAMAAVASGDTDETGSTSSIGTSGTDDMTDLGSGGKSLF
ncbi:MAG: 6,7-dimethyl-8-ribityllumazine synthase [Candidatus Micrarchaeota archaeon]